MPDRLGQLPQPLEIERTAMSTGTLTELIDKVDHRDDVFSDIELVIKALDVGGDYAYVEWSVALTHTGTLTVDDRTYIKPTGIAGDGCCGVDSGEVAEGPGKT